MRMTLAIPLCGDRHNVKSAQHCTDTACAAPQGPKLMLHSRNSSAAKSAILRN